MQVVGSVQVISDQDDKYFRKHSFDFDTHNFRAQGRQFGWIDSLCILRHQMRLRTLLERNWSILLVYDGWSIRGCHGRHFVVCFDLLLL